MIAKREKLDSSKRIVCVLPDNLSRYITKNLAKEWMVEKGLIEPKELVG
jgi:hypothetical protein